MVGTNNLKKGNKHRRLKRLLLIFTIVLIIAIVILISYYKKALLPIDSETPREVSLEIPTGTNSSQIATILKEENLISDELIFKIVLRKNNAEGLLKAGYYTLNTGMTLEEIITAISSGGENRNVVSFTIPEGYEIRHIAEKLSEEDIVDKDRFLELTSNKEHFENEFLFLSQLDEDQSLEGYLFPSTYEIYIGATEEDIIKKMLQEFEIVYEKSIKEYIDNIELSLDEIVTLASIIEREAKRDDERELISAVFINRLEQGMPLQSCATVQYILGERKEVLSDKDTKIESDFNTYIHNGLPPAPIASPGKKSLLAAVNPADVDYLFFRTKEDGTGAHTFTRTYEEHLNADPNK